MEKMENKAKINDNCKPLPADTEENTIFFGIYPQSGNTKDKQPIKWRVLDRKADKALIVTDEAIDCKPYNKELAEITWETCSLRKWLNNTFLNTAFTKEEQSKILSSNVSADKNPDYDTDPGNATTDKVFLLNIKEAKKYLASKKDKKCVPTEYAEGHGAVADGDFMKDGVAACFWWLRSPGRYQNCAVYVDYCGSIHLYGDYVKLHNVCVRPALWITLES